MLQDILRQGRHAGSGPWICIAIWFLGIRRVPEHCYGLVSGLNSPKNGAPQKNPPRIRTGWSRGLGTQIRPSTKLFQATCSLDRSSVQCSNHTLLSIGPKIVEGGKAT